MTQGLFTSASGIRANQVSLDVISNNIANVNTVAFKGSKANFATAFYRTLSGGTGPTNTRGGSNATQLGTGSQLSDISVNFNNGGTQFTGRSTDLVINGAGFFTVESTNAATGESNFYLTRAGNFSLDGNSNLVAPDGGRVRGSSRLDGTSATTDYHINVPQRFQVCKFLDASGDILGTCVGASTATSADFAAYQTAVGAPLTGATRDITEVKLVNISIGGNGAISATYDNGDIFTTRPDPGVANRTEIIHTASEGKVSSANTQVAVNNEVKLGQLTGALSVFSGPTGGNPMQGMQLQIQTAVCPNPQGLIANGKNGYSVGPNAGPLTFGTPASGNLGSLSAGSLESSNIDLAMEFTNLVVAQRGLEANSRMLRAQSEVLQNIIQAV